jgi:uncharacterized protein YcfJ
MKTLNQSMSVALLGMSLAIPLTACNSSAPPRATADQPYSTVNQPYSSASSGCYDCGTITSVEQMTAKGEGSGLGMVLGAVAGAVVGNKVGDGNKIGTVAGAVGGGYAGNEIEKRVKGTKYFEVTVAMDNNGGTRTFDVASTNGLTNGSRVKVVGSNLQILG